MKIIFTSAGRRVELIQEFKKAANQIGISLQIFGTDISDTAPALMFCDKKFIVPMINAPDYIPTLLDICKNEKIDALIPTIDTDLFILSQNKKHFAEIGTTVIISDPEKIKICRDKRLTSELFISAGLNSPRTYDDISTYPENFPAFIKPQDGSSSINAYKANNREELLQYAKNIKGYIIQPFIDGTEYTVDVFCDFYGNPIYITPRIRLSVRAGEVLKTEIKQEKTIIKDILSLIKKYKPCGAITVQLIKETKTDINYYIEINPRFGGGAPLSMKAGANSAAATLSLLNGKKLGYTPFAAENGAVFSRFDQSIRIK